jgi:hypothetical protein
VADTFGLSIGVGSRDGILPSPVLGELVVMSNLKLRVWRFAVTIAPIAAMALSLAATRRWY